MSPARNGHAPPAPAVAPPVARRRAAKARADLRELQRLVRILEHQVPVEDADVQRDLELLADPDAVVRAEPRLRALTALLVSLSTYRRATAAVRARPRRPRAAASAASPARRDTGVSANGVRDPGATDSGETHANGTTLVNGAHTNGRYINGASPPIENVQAVASDQELAAATARYIARDLAARQLSEFTSAEGYRLARALARVGGVEEPVERLLAEANQVRLHPMPLADAVSHSPLGR